MVEINNIEIYSMHIDLKSVVAERFIRKFTYKICKYMTSVSKHNFKKLPKILKKHLSIWCLLLLNLIYMLIFLMHQI